MQTQIYLMQGDITEIAVDAIVNAANSSLLGGGGVDGAIHRAAGVGLLNECRGLGGCETGAAKITAAYNLPARHVIHTVGPVWHGGQAQEDELLARCYRSVCTLAVEHGLMSVAFPCISTGVYRFPKERAARIALVTLRDLMAAHPRLGPITCCCYSAADLAIYQNVYRQLSAAE